MLHACWLALTVAALLVAPGAMATHASQPSPAHGTMVVTGTIVVMPDGGVASYTLDKRDQLPRGVLADLAKVLPQWKFKPVTRDGKAIRAKSHMSVRLVAEPVAGGKYAIMVSGAHFGQCAPGACVAKKRVTAPQYPHELARSGVSGTVYLVLQVGRDGKVQHVAARQVDLQVRGVHWQVKQWRSAMAQASIAAARSWTFSPPVRGPDTTAERWVVSLPVHFRMRGRYQPRYGQWHSYLPGPTRFVPWLGERLASADALPADGSLYPVHQSLQLLSPLGAD